MTDNTPSPNVKSSWTWKRKLFLMLTIIWMAVIFYMSAQPADESSEISIHVGEFLCRLFVPGYGEMSVQAQAAMAENINYPVRKAAHATEYAILSLLLWHIMRKHPYRRSLFLSAAYAASDEFHQLFVPGRAGLITDVLIDTGGATVGLLILFVIHKARYHHKI